jgi:phosphatidylinositol 3-kinase
MSGIQHVDASAQKAFKTIVSKIGTSFRGSDSIGDISTSKATKDRSMWDVLIAQDEFMTGVLNVQQRCRDARGKKDQKEEQLRALLAKEGYGKAPNRDPIPLPSAPHILVDGVITEKAIMFKSQLYPAVLEFHVEATIRSDTKDRQTLHVDDSQMSSYKVIVKTGDDLRQDLLIIMMIQLMDGLLKRAALDLCLTPYSILATSPTSGLVEFVDGATPISQVLAQHNNSILQFFQSKASKKGTKFDIRPDVMSTYIRSCAGYCVITYLLGVGDRHLDNILLRASGHFFHVDFGFILGRDPKPLPPAFRLTREMVDGMGGVNSTEYRQFCSLACQAFNALRKSAGLVLNLLHLMSDAGIEDLSNNPSGDAEGIIAKVEERFRLDLSDDLAELFFLGLINDCLAALAPRVMDVFHALSVARR